MGTKKTPPITPRENYMRLFKGGKLMWMPLATDLNTFNPTIVPDNICRAFVNEAIVITPENFGGLDWFGVRWEYIPVAGGSMVQPGAPKVKDICEWEKDIQFPDLDKLDWEAAAARNKAYLASDKPCNMTIFTGLFERLISLIDFEGAAVALIDEDEQEGVHRLFDRLADFYIALIERFVKYFGMEVLTFHDDWGSQRAPFFSVAAWNEMILPYLKRIIDAAHKNGVIFELHSCGMIEPHVPNFIAAGVDTWRGQPMNDKKRLVHEYGDRFVFGVEIEAGADATEEEMRAGAARFFAEYGDKRVIAVPRCADRSKNALFADILFELGLDYMSEK